MSRLALLLLLPSLTLACRADGEGPGDSDALDGPDVDGPGTIPDTWPPAGIERVVFFGDSITAGAGASKRSLEYPSLMRANDREAWPDWSGGALATRFPDLDGEVLDVSRGGAVTGDLLGQLDRLEGLLDSTPAEGGTLVIVTIGGNDAQQALFPGADAEGILSATLTNIQDWVDALQDGTVLGGPVEILLTNIYEPSDGVGQTEACFFGIDYAGLLPLLDGYNEDLGAWAQTVDVGIADLRGHFLGHGFVDGAGRDLWLASDCIHPNDRGHHEIRRLLFGALDVDPLDTRREDAGETD